MVGTESRLWDELLVLRLCNAGSAISSDAEDSAVDISGTTAAGKGEYSRSSSERIGAEIEPRCDNWPTKLSLTEPLKFLRDGERHTDSRIIIRAANSVADMDRSHITGGRFDIVYNTQRARYTVWGNVLRILSELQ